MDDDFLSVPLSNPCRLPDKEVSNWWLAREFSDVILCSTQALADSIGRPEKSIVAGNMQEVGEYGVTEPAAVVDGEPLRIFWAGSKTHHDDLAVIEDACDRILRKWTPKKVEFLFLGSCPPRLMKNWLYRGLHLERGVPPALYPQVVNRMRPHIALAPLATNVFNRSKSAIRVYEAWSIAAAAVATNYGEYGCIRDGDDGLYADSSDEWFDRIDRLLADRELREHLARNGRRRANDYDWQNPQAAGREPWRKAIRQLSDWSK